MGTMAANHDEQATLAAMLELLFAGNDMDEALTQALALAGTASGVDVLSVYELVDAEECRSRARLRAEWTASGTDSPPAPPLFSEGLERWLDRLHAGHEIGGARGDLEASERRLLELRGFRWLLGIPLRVDGGLWGVALFGDRNRERPVERTRRPFLSALAATLAVGIRIDRTQEQRDNAEQILRVLLDLIPAGVFWKDARGTIRGCNAAFARLAGLEPSARASADSELPHDPTLVGFRDGDGSSTGSVETSRLELHNERGAVSGVLGCCTELPARRDIEDRLRQALKLEALTDLTGEIAHDFNNVLTSINGHAGLALNAVDVASPVRERLEVIQKAVESARDLTQRLAHLSRPHRVERTLVDMDQVLSSLECWLAPVVPPGITLGVAPGAAGACVQADRGHLEYLIQQLVMNAIAAMPDGGKLALSTHIEAAPPAEMGLECAPHLVVEVRDSGTGMTAEIMDRLFDPYFTTRSGGAGMGLTTVLELVRGCDGDLQVESEPGAGSCFRVLLPCVVGAEAAGPGDGATPAPARDETRERLLNGDETLLLVEDNRLVRRVLRIALEELGYRVLEAVDGREGLELYRSFHSSGIDLLVADLLMPELDGRDLACALRTLNPDLRVLLMSGYAERGTIMPAVDFPVSFLQKPFTVDSLAVAVREALDAPARVHRGGTATSSGW